MGMTHQDFFDALRALGPLRIISQSGPSVFEAICRLDAYGIREGHLNAITDAFHWHVTLERFRHVRSHDEVHARSGRRVLFFALRESPEAAPFLLVYVHRGKGEDFGAARAARFTDLHTRLAAGADVAS